ncbi:MAG: 4-hydroxythreonine-4-phosphate dehydrogenase PdxA [Vicinamibacterales bacterium]
MTRSRPRIAMTVGDPAGIGPEIAQRAMTDPQVLEVCEPLLYGPADSRGFVVGQVSAEGGRAAYEAIVAAVRAARTGEIDGLATAPISKESFARAGLPWLGHTDLLAHLCGAPRVAMLFHTETFCVVLATVHVALREVPRLLTRERLAEVVQLTRDAMPDFGRERPRIACAGLNPHAGERGLMGQEDDEVIGPVVASMRAAGIDVVGPLPADTVFVRASRGEFDVVVAAYHDQGLIPVKLLSFGKAVNVTIGLPIVRTSVDHGTAFDIAGRGVADPSSLIAAVRLAARLARVRAARAVVGS